MALDLSNYLYWEQDKKCSFQDYDLILPDISIGNVGQLAIDLLLNNLTTEHLGRVVHPCFLPFIGSDPFQLESKRLTSSCEIYECKEKKLVILQIRSFVFPSKVTEFENLIIHFYNQCKFKQMILLASSSSEYFSADQLEGVPIHYLSTSQFSNKEKFNQLKWKEFSLPDKVDIEEITPIPGSFISHDMLQDCENNRIPLVVLLCVCSEGDNSPEALQVMKCMNSWLNLKLVNDSEETWKMPVSWKLPYGSAPPQTMY